MRGRGICAAVGQDLLPRLDAIAIGRKVAAGRTLFEEGDPADDVFTITAGMIKLYKLMSDGRRQIVGFLVPGDFLGLAFGRTYVYTAEAVVATTTCRFSRQQFHALLDECPTLEKEILTRTATELAAAQEQMLLLGRKTARERVASFLLALARRRKIGPAQPFALLMSRADIADYLGLTVETVSRTLGLLGRNGMIELADAHTVVIRRQVALEQVAGS
jgi:CRP/FNR family transcriptional regulator, anaerobic regulatory protein